MGEKSLDLGLKGERLAENYLRHLGYKIIARNWRPKRWGEIDLIAIEEETLVFIEVKTRSSKDYGEPQEFVDPHKINTLIRSAWYFKLENPDTPEAMRIDVAAITLDSYSNNNHKIQLFRDVRPEDLN